MKNFLHSPGPFGPLHSKKFQKTLILAFEENSALYPAKMDFFLHFRSVCSKLVHTWFGPYCDLSREACLSICQKINNLKIPFPGKYIVSSLLENLVPEISRKHWKMVSGWSNASFRILVTEMSKRPSRSIVKVVVSPRWSLL